MRASEHSGALGEIATLVGLLASGRVRNAHGVDWLVDGGQTQQI